MLYLNCTKQDRSHSLTIHTHASPDRVLHPGRGSPEDLGDLPSYAAARPTRCPLKRMFMTYTLQSLARCAHPCEVGNAIDRDEASRAADKVAFERHLDITPQILLHLGSSPCRLVIDRQRLERSVPALDMKSMSARFD